MANKGRRNLLRLGSTSVALPWLALLELGCAPQAPRTPDSNPPDTDTRQANPAQTVSGITMKIHYLEIVTPDVDALCETYARVHGVTFATADANLGLARTTRLPDGGLLGVRAPLRETETPIVRPYFLVDDIDAAVSQAAAAGAEIALPPMELPGHGKCAIFLQGGVEQGLWQL